MFIDNLFLIFLVGAVIGSFLNVCIYRLPKNLDIVYARSSCPKCKKKINWFDNIPLISFIILKFNCRFCKKSISPQYFLVELISALFLCFAFVYLFNYLDIILLGLIFYILVIIFFIDLKHFIIPNELTFPLMVIGFLKSFDPNLNPYLFPDYIHSLIGGVVGFPKTLKRLFIDLRTIFFQNLRLIIVIFGLQIGK